MLSSGGRRNRQAGRNALCPPGGAKDSRPGETAGEQDGWGLPQWLSGKESTSMQETRV